MRAAVGTVSAPGTGGQAPQFRMDALQPALEHLTDVVQQVPAVGDLHRPGCCHRDAAGVFGRAVARHYLDGGLRAQPGRHRLGLPVGQQIDDAASLQVDDDRAVGLPAAQGPVVDADDPRRLHDRQRQASLPKRSSVAPLTGMPR